MSKQIDLNELRDAVLQTQRDGNSASPEEQNAILVNQEGEIIMARDASDTERRTLAKVPQDTFHGRAQDEAITVQKLMPKSTRAHKTSEGIDGWVYSFKCAYGHDYTMFAYFDGSNYQVLVVSPEVEAKYRSPHTGHIFGDGRICFGTSHGSGRPTLRDAYAKSVLWATGMSSILLSGSETFPFSVNNL